MPGTCSNGGCRRVASFLVRTSIRDERPVCGPCADSLASLYPERREIEGVPAWVRRMDRNARAWTRSAA